MKKSLLTLGVACLALSSVASTKILYQQTFETAPDVASTGWSFGGESLTITSDDYGKFLELYLGGQNGRSGNVKWGQEIFLDKDGGIVLEDGTYNLKFDFCYAAGSTNQYNGSITVFTNATGVANQPYVNGWSNPIYRENYLFNMSQDAASMQFAFMPKMTYTPEHTETVETTDAEGNTVQEEKVVAASIVPDLSESMALETGMWYTVSLDVNTETRVVDWQVIDVTKEEVASGTYEVPEVDYAGNPISMYAEGIWAMVARYQTKLDFDNIVVSYESEFDSANPPIIALTSIGKDADDALNLNMRGYTVSFGIDETLHIVGTDGATEEIEYADCEGNYKLYTTTSGTLKAWTTYGDATSEVVEETVDCTPIVLPKAEYAISSVSEGYKKTYTLTVDNSEVPLRPAIFISYEFNGADGTVITGADQVSGVKVALPGEGKLTITTNAFGYQGSESSVVNDIEYATKKVYDFARMTKDDIDAAIPGATWYVLNSATTSGFSNWTARKRLFYNIDGTGIENEEGKMVYEAAYPFGFISEENETNVINYAVLDRSADGEYDSNSYFEGLTIFPDKGKLGAGLPNVGMIYRIGLYNDQTTNANNNVIVNNLAATDFVCVNYINNYGGNSNHPVCATDEEYYAQLAGEDAVIAAKENGETVDEKFVGNGTYSATHSLYRVDTAITKITVFEQVGAGSVEGVATEVIGDGYYYTIDGLRLAEPTRPGLYIHNGKKIIVK